VITNPSVQGNDFKPDRRTKKDRFKHHSGIPQGGVLPRRRMTPSRQSTPATRMERAKMRLMAGSP